MADEEHFDDPQALLASLPSEHLRWHVWQRAEIENYLLHLPAITRLVASGTDQLTIDEVMLKQEFEKLIDDDHERLGVWEIKAAPFAICLAALKAMEVPE